MLKKPKIKFVINAVRPYNGLGNGVDKFCQCKLTCKSDKALIKEFPDKFPGFKFLGIESRTLVY